MTTKVDLEEAKMALPKGLTTLYLLPIDGNSHRETNNLHATIFKIFAVKVDPLTFLGSLQELNKDFAPLVGWPWNEKRGGFEVRMFAEGNHYGRNAVRARELTRAFSLRLWGKPTAFEAKMLLAD